MIRHVWYIGHGGGRGGGCGGGRGGGHVEDNDLKFDVCSLETRVNVFMHNDCVFPCRKTRGWTGNGCDLLLAGPRYRVCSRPRRSVVSEERLVTPLRFDDEPLEDLSPDDHPSQDDTNSTSLIQKETEESQELRAMEKATTHNTLQNNRMQTRSQIAKNRNAQQDKLPRDFPQQENETERIEDRNDSLDGESDAESDNEEKNQEKEEFEEEYQIHKLKEKTGQ
ncbi:hypothetical protein G5I_01873 [Acromyrmex echinatior]|uniref:Uncharacterized protein n=1 Tax=Acromyrmex echinatior TaxID=103372 RepID=F4W8T6_ACREC|nr:hypothetical protein G5I_01873 [Acromyrmex echinatior]